MSEPALDIEPLSPAERWELIERLWASLGDQPLELTAQTAELDRRLASLDEDIAHGRKLGTPWDEVRARLFQNRSGW